MIRAARIFAPISALRLALADAFVVALTFIAIVHFTVAMDTSLFFLEERGALRLLPLIAVLILGMYFGGLYERKRLDGRIFLLQQLAFAGGIALVSQALIAWTYNPLLLPKNFVLYGLAASMVSLFCWRLLRDAILSNLEGTGTVLILGTDATGHRIARHIELHPALHLRVVGSLTNSDCAETAIQPVLGGLSELKEIARSKKPDMIVAGLLDARDLMPVSEMVDLRYGGVRIEEAGSACELICRCVSARDLRPSRILFTTEFDPRDVPFVVFVVDAVVSAVLLILGAPFALLYAIMLKISDGGTVIEKENCVGYLGRPIVSRHFRVEGSGFPALFARAFNLEYWPQLWNVLLGSMSMVGPRPHRADLAAELNRLLPIHEYRQNARPGITGWAQINLDKEERVADALREIEYDLYYVRYPSISLYSYILLHGLRATL